MSAGVLEPLEVGPHGESAAADSDPGPLSGKRSIERWLDGHLDGLALAVVAAGFVIRLYEATRSYLNPDEALHYLLLNQATVSEAYKFSLTNAHPPLIYLLVYFWHFLGRSELMLRLPSVLAGTAFCWLNYLWIKKLFGKAAAGIGVILCTFSPAMIALSAELRAYALLLFCIGGALYFLSRAFDEKEAERSARQMWYFPGFLCLAILSHYSAVFFALALGIYVLARIGDSELPRKAVYAWAAGQAGALAVCAFLYVTHIAKIKSSLPVWATLFDSSYFHWGSGNIFVFTRASTLNIFLFLFGQRFVAEAILFSYLCGMAYLFARDLTSHGGEASSRRSGILLLMPFVAVWGASLAGIYPYAGSRHTAFVAPFAIAGASFLLAGVLRQKLWAGLLLAVLLMTVSNTYGKPSETFMVKGSDDPKWMAAAMSQIKQDVPPGSPIFVDVQSNLMLTYYLCGPGTIIPKDSYDKEYFRFECNGHSIISLHLWKLIEGSFPAQFKRMAQANALTPGDQVWVFQAGWGENLGVELPKRDAKFRCITPKVYGENISLFSVIVGPDYSPVAASPGC